MSLAGLRIAVIEDNVDLREELLFFLRHRGYSAWGVGSAEAFWKELHRNPVEVVIVDLGLPGEDGFSVIEYLHALGGYGLVILTAQGGERERLRGINLGADLFLVKPINFASFTASLYALCSRLRAGDGGTNSGDAVFEVQQDKWLLDLEQMRLSGPIGDEVVLSSQELDLLKPLMRSAAQIFSREALHDLLFDYAEETDTHRIDVILSRLRAKAKKQGLRLPIRSVFGKGIVFTGKAACF